MGTEHKMLRLCVTLCVLLRLQAAVTGGRDLVEESCQSIICYPISKVAVYDEYEEVEVPSLHWLYTSVNGTDLETAANIALDRLLDYSYLNNAAETIVPVSAPWSVYINWQLANGIAKPEFTFYILLPLEVQSPPEPRDPRVQIDIMPQEAGYESYWITEQKNEDYLKLANDLKRHLEDDQRSFDSSGFYITWFNTRGHFKIIFLKK
ncbi:uncharacterized protein [Hemitrygon akajei]|uniref:uncharacterized protein n=1 Tax=Hemitrygon akajei TaxID=2704970 RepID=UPI003BF9C0F2